MRFGLFGSIVQLEPGSEGYVLRQAGLLQTGGQEWELEIQPTPLLRSLFTAMPDMEELYPLLVEFVLAMKHGLGLNKILGTIHIYPTMAEANKYAAGEWKRAHAPARVLAWLARYHTWRRGGSTT